MSKRFKSSPVIDENSSQSVYNNASHDSENQSNILLDDKHVVLKNKELVIINPIRAKNLKICQVNCTNCPKTTAQADKLFIFEDLKFFGNILQYLLSMIILFIVYFYSNDIYSHCKREYLDCEYYSKSFSLSSNKSQTVCKCLLDKCHISIIFYYILGINMLTILLLSYDKRQLKRGSFRLHNRFLYFLIWAGGYLALWSYVILFKYKKNEKETSSSSSRFFVLALLSTLLSLTGPFLYYVLVHKL
jgi:uncharacterized membrane protein YsdA (DUF1294 family)